LCHRTPSQLAEKPGCCVVLEGYGLYKPAENSIRRAYWMLAPNTEDSMRSPVDATKDMDGRYLNGILTSQLISYVQVLAGCGKARSHSSLVSGHDFSHAVNAAKYERALAPEGCVFGPCSVFPRPAIAH
jgi:hypothetical protein